MKIAIIGTRGIPNNYGGFEQFAEYLSKALAEKGHSMTVYNSHNHPNQKKEWEGVEINHQFDPEYFIGTFGQFIYDFNCIWHTRKRNYDIILQLGYTSSSIWSFLFPNKSLIVTNMDGLEWKRTKYSNLVKRFLKYAEYLGVVKSNYLVADSPAIKDYLNNEYGAYSEYIPYGAFHFSNPDDAILEAYELEKYNYDMLVARMERENNIETILDGVAIADTKRTFLVIGNSKNTYGENLKVKFSKSNNIKFLGSIYDGQTLNNLRYYSNLYFHGHSVGGTNPSLLEAMASNALICAHKNVFNKSILGDDAHYFESTEDIFNTLTTVKKLDTEYIKIQNNSEKILKVYSWEKVIAQYQTLFVSIMEKEKQA